MPSEATSQYLDRIGADAAALLGPGISVLGVERDHRHGLVRLTLRYDVAGTAHQTVATGETVVAAHAALRAELVQDRVRYAFESLVIRQLAPPPYADDGRRASPERGGRTRRPLSPRR